MNRTFLCATALCTLALVGCDSLSPNATALAAPAATASQDQDAAAADAASNESLATNIDSEVKKAQALRAQGDYDGASHILSQLMLMTPDDPRVVGEYGKVLAQRGKSQDAVAFLQRAIELQPNDWTLYSALGVGYDQLDNRPAAKTAYEHALALKPNEPVVLNNYAVSRALAGDYDGAQRMLVQAEVNGASYSKIGNNLQMVADLRSSKTAPVATAAPATATVSAKPAASHAPVSIATLAPPRTAKPLPANVVMQRVPVDPQAGPVASATHAPRKLAVDAPAKHSKAAVAKAADKSPSLRTAAD